MIKTIVDVFRDEPRGQTFLIPSKSECPELAETDKIDLSHEVLLRRWGVYARWLAQEREDAANFIWLADAADRKARDEDEYLGISALKAIRAWQKKSRPTAEWAQRYIGPYSRQLKRPTRSYASAFQFLEQSKAEANRQIEGREAND